MFYTVIKAILCIILFISWIVGALFPFTTAKYEDDLEAEIRTFEVTFVSVICSILATIVLDILMQ